MLDHLIENPHEGQPIAQSLELLDLLRAAQQAGLIRPADGAEIGRLEALVAIGMEPSEPLPDIANRFLAAGPAAERALDALARLFSPEDVIELRALDPAGGGAVSLSGRLGVSQERAALADFINAHNGRRNLYVGVNPRLASLSGTGTPSGAAEVACRVAAVIDLDLKDAPATDPEWAQTRAELTALGPELILDSGNGWHFWLRLDPLYGEDMEAATGPLAASMANLGADNMADLPRIGRLSCTPNLPTPSKRKRGAVPRMALPVPLAQAAVRRPVEALCQELDGVAHRLALPGRSSGSGTGGKAPSRLGANGQPKTPWAAPSAELLRRALELMPTDLADREAWVRIATFAKGAAVAGGYEAKGREAFLEWSSRHVLSKPAEDARMWDTLRDPRSGWGSFMRELEQHNPTGRRELAAEEARAAFAGAAASNVAALSARPVQPVQPFSSAGLTPRRWLYGHIYLRGFISALVAPGGVGKSALGMVRALALATGRELLPGERPMVGPVTVWYHNAEDTPDEQLRRLAGAMDHYGITHADIAGRLILTAGTDVPIQLARMGRDGPELTPGTADWIVGEARRLGVDVLLLDPLGAVHSLPENSNEAVNMLAGSLRQIARDADIAIGLVHHVGKAAALNMREHGANAARGASALTDACRVVEQLSRMTPEEGRGFALPAGECWRQLRLDNGKSNLAPAAAARWLHLASVSLGNKTAEYPSGDTVQVAESWTPPVAVAGTASELAAVQNAIASTQTPPRYDARAADWVGWLIAGALNIDAGAPGVKSAHRSPEQERGHARVRSLLDGWLADGRLVRRKEHDSHRNERDCVVVGRPAIFADTDAQSVPDSEDSAG